jgi:hypothetical protein
MTNANDLRDVVLRELSNKRAFVRESCDEALGFQFEQSFAHRCRRYSQVCRELHLDNAVPRLQLPGKNGVFNQLRNAIL